MNDHDQAVLDGIERATMVTELDRSASALVHALAAFSFLEAERLHTKDILAVLEVNEAFSHWATIPVPAAARELASLLEDHDVKPKSVTVAGRRARGYAKADLENAWLAVADQASLTDTNDNDNDDERD
jgi:hypothetical protein